ncbi:hypothetical protein BSL78_12951 [Apostichopus japonicus]|uniref:Nucleoside phosphorylase domain-containing protein n=1 Tax=Stichopus japonicus TaxID=307972 RepID=A0A2G8KQ65_STIJA|nr:hypothetical protein BSL78_12951 [Apostichopus japonicus]
MVTIEGPRFSSRAESIMFRSWQGDVINMTTVPEVVLANELGLPYAAIAMATDYDSWREDPQDHVDCSKVMKTLQKNSENAEKILKKVIRELPSTNWHDVILEHKFSWATPKLLRKHLNTNTSPPPPPSKQKGESDRGHFHMTTYLALSGDG